MTTKTQILHYAAIQPINNFYYNGDNEYIHNTGVDSQQLAFIVNEYTAFMKL